jgi:hypothetical protein
MQTSLIQGVYDDEVDRVSAYEILEQRAEQAAAETAAAEEAVARAAPQPRVRASGRQTAFEAFAKSALRSLGTQLGRSLVRGILGSLSGGRRR